MRDIADYSGSWGFGSFSNATQHITETDIIKANVFKVGQFYERSEGQSYANLGIFSDMSVSEEIGQFNFCWAFTPA